jgi:hypothetical protein
MHSLLASESSLSVGAGNERRSPSQTHGSWFNFCKRRRVERFNEVVIDQANQGDSANFWVNLKNISFSEKLLLNLKSAIMVVIFPDQVLCERIRPINSRIESFGVLVLNQSAIL